MVETAITLIILNAVGMAYLVLRSFGIGYGTKKGNNAADIEDLPRLTQIVEEIKQQNAMLLESLKSQNQLRVAAIDKRLQAHQEAFRHWSRLLTVVFDQEAMKQLVTECWEWWLSNCLYLEPSAREAFRIAMATAPDHAMIVDANRGTGNAKPVQDSWANIFGAGDIIVKAVALPGLTVGEGEQLKMSTEQPLPLQ
ncbi:hypothetical protein [Variovorax sp. PAMC26660]|uniref:hypothetical protein n=1 Tax=Variovorax sp. PAMC26660 TaxID=2762322 RepID=UPI00164CFE1E|nr:hypothetical protein [Variovorax sp. PAMC26660]QNK66072.1 hypothetical protein H7F35_23105 [Variovorax sp. PAMC26660]